MGVHCQLLKTFEKMTVVLQLAKKSVVDGNSGRKEERKRSPFVQVLYDYEPGWVYQHWYTHQIGTLACNETHRHIGSIEDTVVCSPFRCVHDNTTCVSHNSCGICRRSAYALSRKSRKEAHNTILHYRTLELLVQLDKSAPLMCAGRAGPLKFKSPKSRGRPGVVYPSNTEPCLLCSSHKFAK